MNLSFAILQDNLPEEYRGAVLGDRRRGRSLPRPVLYTGEGELSPDKFYVTRTDLLPLAVEIRARCMVCVGRGDVEALLGAGCSVLHLPETGDFIRVFNAVTAVYDRFDAWENTLRDQLEQEDGFDYHALALTGAAMLDNTVGLSDQFLHVLFTTARDAEGRWRIAEGLYDTMLLSIDEKISAVCQKERQLREPYLSSFAYQGVPNAYCCNIFPLDHFVGCCFIYPDRHPFRESDYEIADVFFRYFSRALTKYIRNCARQEDPGVRAVRTLLLGQPLSRDEKKLLALTEQESWVFFRLAQRSGERVMPLEYMHATIVSLMPHVAFAGLDGEKLVGLLKIQREADLTESGSFSALYNILEHMGYCVGFSNAFRDLSRLSEYRFQADYALRFLRKSRDGKKIYCVFNDCVLDYMLSACTANLSLDSLFSRQFRRLLDYDREHGAALGETLECYLRNETNISATARELFLHRSSLIKRLDRIRELLECDLTNPKLNLYYRMCFELIHRTEK